MIGGMLFNIIGAVLLCTIWWPFRKTDALRSVPWLVVGFAILRLSSLPMIDVIKKASVSGHLTGAMLEHWTKGDFLLGAIWKILCYLMVLANAAFLLDRAGFSSRLINLLKCLYTRHLLSLGAAFLITSILSSCLFWIIFHCSQ